MVCVRAAVNMLLSAVARGPGVWAEGGGGAGEGERWSVVVVVVTAIVFRVGLKCNWRLELKQMAIVKIKVQGPSK